MRTFRFAILGLVWLSAGAAAWATPVTVNASYTVSSIDAALGGLVNLGDTGAGTWTIDAAALTACVLPACSATGLVPGQLLYIDPTATAISMTSTLGPWSFASTPGSSNLLVSNDATFPGPPPTPLDAWQPLTSVSPVGPVIPVAPGNSVAVGLFLGDTTLTAQSDLSIFVPGSAAAYNVQFFTITEFDRTGAPVKNLLLATLDSYSVPEPGAGLLVGVVACALWWRRRAH